MKIRLNNPLDLLSLKLLGLGVVLSIHHDGDEVVPGRWVTLSITYAVGGWSKSWKVS